MKHLFFAAAILLLLNAQTVAADDKAPTDAPRDYANRLTIDTNNAVTSQGLARLRLPLDVYRGVATANLRDLRVFNASGERVPFALTSEPDRSLDTRTLSALPIFPVTQEVAGRTGNTALTVKLQTDGTLVMLSTSRQAAARRNTSAYLVDASRHQTAISALHFAWQKNAHSQTGRVTIEASADLKNWRTLARDAPLIDMAFNGEQLTQTKVDVAVTDPAADKYLRLTWAGVPFTLTKLEAEHILNATERHTESIRVNGAAGKNAGEYTFDLAARLPIERVRLLLPEANTLAPAQLSVEIRSVERKSGGGMENVMRWQPVANATFYRLNRDGVEMVSPPVAVANTVGAQRWQAKIDARGGGIGGNMPTLEAIWQPQQLVFAIRGNPPFTLAFGRIDAKPADFPISHLMPGYQARDEFRLPLVGLQTVNDGQVIAPPAASGDRDWDWKKIALWAVLIVGVALMAWMAVRLGRDVGQGGQMPKR